MPKSIHILVALVSAQVLLTFAQQQCYFGPGAENRGPTELVPCKATGQSACCLLGDVCFSGSVCWNYETGNTYQYGCTDIRYEDESCPYKCGFNTTLSPWTALEYCVDPPGISDTWVCHAPESCGCEWSSTPGMLVLQQRGCQDMGSDARVALNAPSQLAPYLSLPSSIGGSTGYISTTTVNGTKTWVSTPVPGYMPATVTELTNYGHQPTTPVYLNSTGKPSASTYPAASTYSERSNTAVESARPDESNDTASNATAIEGSKTGLTVAAKAGIGAGVGGGLLVITVIALTILLCLKRQKKTQPGQQHILPHQISPPMQQASPYFAQHDKDQWHTTTYPAGSSPPMVSPHFDPTYHGHYSHIVPSLHSERRSQKPPSISPPTELSADRHVHELHSEQVASGSDTTVSTKDEKGDRF